MEIKYAIRKVCVNGHDMPAYLQKTEYGLQFSYRASMPHEIHYFESKDEAIEFMKRR
jgi:hypothetical protein